MEIDLVYLWVDGNDPCGRLKKMNCCLPTGRWIPKRRGSAVLSRTTNCAIPAFGPERYAPWIRRVYIAPTTRRPRLGYVESLARVQVVSHREIMPAEILPVFNSCTIELFLPRIPGLAEHFLYANDDISSSAAPLVPVLLR